MDIVKHSILSLLDPPKDVIMIEIEHAVCMLHELLAVKHKSDFFSLFQVNLLLLAQYLPSLLI